MFRLLLLVVVATSSVNAVPLKLQYTPPALKITVPIFDSNVRSVVFNYGVSHHSHKGQGVKTSEGWQFQIPDISIYGVPPASITVNAVAYDINGNFLMSTLPFAYTPGLKRSLAQLPPRRIRGAVIWRDDFNSFDSSKWKYEVSMFGGYNGEFQVYTNDQKNVYTKDGLLYIKPTLTVNDARFDDNSLLHGKMDVNALFGYCTISAEKGCYRDAEKDGILPPIMSGKISSMPSLKYGTVEVRARIPKGDWIWPAIWLMPKTSKYGWWPKSGEIDIMESTGNEGYWGIQRTTTTLHWGPDASHNKFLTTQGYQISNSWHDDFHTWTMDWTPDHIITYVDGKKIFEVSPPSGGFWEKGDFTGNNLWQSGGKMAPFDQDFYLILNVAVGGTRGMFTDGPNKPWKNSSPKAMEEFWNARSQWMPSWQGDHVAMEIDYVEFRHL